MNETGLPKPAKRLRFVCRVPGNQSNFSRLLGTLPLNLSGRGRIDVASDKLCVPSMTLCKTPF